MVIVNAYVLYRKYGNAGKHCNHQNFHGALIRALIWESADLQLHTRVEEGKVNLCDD